jgi:hypothetical protein
MGTAVLFQGIKRLKSEVNLTPSLRVEVKNDWSYTSTPPYVFMARTGKTLIGERSVVGKSFEELLK